MRRAGPRPPAPARAAPPEGPGVAVGLVTCRTWPDLSESDGLLRRALEERGARVVAPAWNDPAARFDGLTAVVLRSCWDYHHDVPAFLAWLDDLDRRGVRVWNPPDLVRWNVSKRYLLELAAGGVAVPGTALLDGDNRDVGRLMDARGWSRAVVKPLVSASAHDTALVRREDAARATAGLAAGALRHPALVQAYVEEIGTRGEWSLVFVDGAPTHAVLKRPAAGDFRVQPRFGGRAEPGRPPDTVARAAQDALARVPGAPLYARVDIVDAAAGPLLMELELIEPGLFLAQAPAAAGALAEAILRRAATPRAPA